MPDKLIELTPPERYLFLHSKLGKVNFQGSESPRLYLYTNILHEIALQRKRPQVNGALPEEGPVIAVADHVKMRDIFLMYWLPLVTANRPLRLAAKANLVYPDVQESEAMRNRRSKRSPLKKAVSALGIDSFANRHIAVPYCRGFQVFPFNTGDANSVINNQSMHDIRKELFAGRIVGVFQTGTRRPPLDLLDALPLAANIASFHPDVPVYTIGISYDPYVINISPEPMTYRQVVEPYSAKGRLGRREGVDIMRRAISDSIGNLIADPRLYPAWWLERHGFYTEDQLRLLNAANQNLYSIYLAARRNE